LRELREVIPGPFLGDENFLALLEQNLGRILRRQKPGPKDVQAR
jgi:hypothetical protein